MSNKENVTSENNVIDDMDDNLIPGSIAEREHKKWENAAPIANNPYSADKLQRRLSEKQSPGAFDYNLATGTQFHSNESRIDDNESRASSTTPEKLVDIFKADQTSFKR